jgi:hypothetical protein
MVRWGLPALVLSMAGAAWAQSASTSVPLGDVARQFKAQRAKSEVKPRVITNDDIANLPGPSFAQGQAETDQKAGPGGAGVSSSSAQAAKPGPAREARGEQYFRGQMRKLQDQLEMHQRELNVLQQKLGQNEMVYYLDPNQGLMQQSGPTAMSDVHSLQDQIEKKKAEIDADQEAIENLQVELRRAGGEAGWLRLDERPSQAAGAERVQPGKEPQSKEDWQARFESARRRLASAREQQQLAEDELGLLQMQYVRELNDDAKADLGAKVSAKEAEVSEKKTATAAAEKDLKDLQDAFKASGAATE